MRAYVYLNAYHPIWWMDHPIWRMILDPLFMLNRGQKLGNDFEMDLDVMSALKIRKWPCVRNLDLFKAVLKSEHLGKEGEGWDEWAWEKPSYALAMFYFSTRGREANIERCSDWLKLRDANLGVIIVFAFSACLMYFIWKQQKQQNKAKSNSSLARQCCLLLFLFSSESPWYQRRAQQSENFWWFSD